MQLINILILFGPKIVEAAQQGQAAWKKILEAQKVAGDEELNAKLDAMASEDIRRGLISEWEATH